MVRAKGKDSSPAQEEALPQWADNEIKTVKFGEPEVITRTGYFLAIYENDRKVDIQVYEPIPDGRSIVEGLDVPPPMKISDFMKGSVYEFKINIYAGPLSEKLVDLLKSKYGIEMRAIYKFDLADLQLMDVESDLPSGTSSSEEEEGDEE